MYKKLRQYIESIVNKIGIVHKKHKTILVFLSSIIIVLAIIKFNNISSLVLDIFSLIILLLLTFQLIVVYKKSKYIALLNFLLLLIMIILFVLIIKTAIINTSFTNNKTINAIKHFHHHIKPTFIMIIFVSQMFINYIFICFVTRRSIINTLLRKMDVLPLRLATVDSYLSDGLLSIEQAKQERKNIIINYHQNCLIDVFSKFLNILFIVSFVAMIIVIIYCYVVCNTKSVNLLSYSIYWGVIVQFILFLYGLSIFLWNRYLY